MQILKYIPIIILIGLLQSCNNPQKSHGHSHDVIGGAAAHDDHDDHGSEATAISYTLFADGYELFVEFESLVKGQTSSFAAHFTRLDTYKPVLEGQITVSLIKGNKGIRHTVEKPASPGIFRPALQPKESGTYKLLFELKSQHGDVTFAIDPIEVFSTAEDAAIAAKDDEHIDGVSFLKEQAWKTEFATREIKPEPFYSIIHTSARVKNQPQSTTLMHAKTEGSVNMLIVLGQSVKKGDLVAVISSSGVENNLSFKLNKSSIAFEKSRSDYNRAKQLIAENLVSKKEYLNIESRYKQDSLLYFQLANAVSQNGLKLIAPANGIVTKITSENGQFVKNGDPILTINSKNNLLIEAYVNQSDFEKVEGIFDANFSKTESGETITLSELKGKIVAKNGFVSESNTRIPVSFYVQNNGMLMPGMYLEAFLKTGQKNNAIVIPLSSVIEEQGQHFVYVQAGGESFEKRRVQIANNDGIRTEISSGLSVGDRIVTEGAYQIKLAAMAGDLPLHGHTH
ncbi:MAG: hypothetical protein C0599_04490 [Salinivirgaceae bacterium]|nr:MAG: hypothetical protein C0599_04490 [Salinivirgaceae bacterium]